MKGHEIEYVIEKADNAFNKRFNEDRDVSRIRLLEKIKKKRKQNP